MASRSTRIALLGLALSGSTDVALEGFGSASPSPPAPPPAVVGQVEVAHPRGSPMRAQEPRAGDLPLPEDYWLWLLLVGASQAMARVDVLPPPSDAWESILDAPGIEETVERLRRLVALSGSSNEHEAMAAATKVARMLREQGLVEALSEYLSKRRVGVGEDRVVLALLTSGAAPSAEAVVLAARTADPESPVSRRALRLRLPYVPSLVKVPQLVNWRTVAIVTVVAGAAYAIGVKIGAGR